ncbi:MAG: DsbC family protein [Pseudomonadota bacterium]|jgi:thiol:disulfide interchange protein DsbC
MLKVLFAAAAMLAVGSTSADDGADQRVRAAIKALVPEARVDQVEMSVLPGFYEVVMGGQVIYVSGDGKYVVSGVVWDAAARKNLTESRYAGIRKSALASVPADKRIIFPAKNARHTITVFTDIDCGYCRRMHQEMAQYNELGITVEYLFYPRAGRGSESWNKAVSVWCAADHNGAMTAAKNGEPVPNKTDCSNPVDSDFELGQQIGVSGTPAVIAADGTQIGGYLPPEQMLERLQQLQGGR